MDNKESLQEVQNYTIHKVKPGALPIEDQHKIARSMEALTEGLVTFSHLLEQFQKQLYDIYLAYDERARIIGYGTVHHTSEEDRVYVNKIHVGKQWRQKGVATKILKQIMQDYKKINFLNITPDSATQIAMGELYKRLGFRTENGISYSIGDDES